MKKYKYLLKQTEDNIRMNLERMTHNDLKALAQFNTITKHSFPDNADIQNYCSDVHDLILEYLYPDR